MFIAKGHDDGGGIMDKVTGFFSSIKDSIVNSSFQWFNFDMSPQGIGDIIMLLVNIFFTIVAVAILASIIFILGRYPMRYIHEKIRMSYLGGMVWSEVIHEGVISDAESYNAVGQMDNMMNIMRNVSTGFNFGFTYNRPRYAIAIRLNPEDEQLHMYIGMDKRNYDPNMMADWAAGANCSVEEIDFDEIGFVPRAPMALAREGYNTSNFSDSPTNSSVGGVIQRLQSNSNIRSGATVVVSYEVMRESEETLLKAHINSKNVKEGGDAAKLDKTAHNINIFTSKSPVRSTITAFSDNGDYGVSHSVLSTVQNNMPSRGVRVSANKFESMHRKAGIISIFPSMLLMLLGWINFIPLWIPCVALALSLSSIIGLSFMSSLWISLASSSTMSPPIPPYVRFSLRRLWNQAVINISPFDVDSGIAGNRYMGEPSMREIIPLYQTSLMQFASVPLNGSFSNMSSLAIPQVTMSNAVNQDIQSDFDNDHVALLGTSVKSMQPVMETASDLNFGIAIAGNPGSGKTNELRNLFAGVSHLSRADNGYTFTPIWIETKSDDLRELSKNIETYHPHLFSIHERNQSTRLCFEGPRLEDGTNIKDVIKNISILITGMEKLWGAGAFGPRSKQVATAALTISMLLTRKERDALGLSQRVENPDRPNIMTLMKLLIGSDPSFTLVNVDKRNKLTLKNGKETTDGPLEIIANGYRNKIYNAQEMDKIKAKYGMEEVNRMKALVAACDALIGLFNTPDAVKPLQNKLPVLDKSEGLWETVDDNGNPRDEFSVKKFIDYKGPVLIDATSQHSTLSAYESRQFTMLFHYLLWEELRSYGAGWAKQNRFTPIFVDELSNIVGKKEDESTLGDIIEEVRDQGRSSGVSHNVGFQRFDQLPSGAESSVNNFSSKLFFQMESAADRDKVMAQLGENTRFTSDNVKSIPVGYAIADMRLGGKKRSAFTIKTPYFNDFVSALVQSDSVKQAFDTISYEEKEKITRDKKMRTDDDDTTTNVILDHHDDDTSHHDTHSSFHDDNDDDDFGLTWS